MIGIALDLLVCALVIGAALAAVAGRDHFGSIVFFIIYGVLVAIAWTRLGAVDVALAEAAIGAGLTGVILVTAAARVGRLAAGCEAGWSRSSTLAALACAALTVALGAAVLTLEADAPGLGLLVTENLEATGVGNPVTAVLLNIRAYDTLLESLVLLVALVGVWSLAEDRHWGGVPGLRQTARPDGVLATFGRFLPPVGLVVGVYIVWAGAEAPGGAFQGGTVLAAVWLLVAMAGLAEAPPVASRRLRLALVAGPALFLGIGLAGAAAGAFLGLPEAWAKPLTVAIEVGLTLSIAATLALLVLGPPQRSTSGA
jgi:multisubunit Na+/H+ antiporter MnhB subunit